MRAPPNSHPNPLSGWSEDYPEEELDDWQDKQPGEDDDDTEGQIWAARLEMRP